MSIDRVAGGFWGLLVADALGVPYEFHAAGDLPHRLEREMVPPLGFRRAHAGVPPGTWSDDGAQALALLDALLHGPQDVADGFGERLLAWYEDGAYTPDGVVYDVGITTSTAIRRLAGGMRAGSAGPDGERDNGNGALMRVLPVALFHHGTASELEVARVAMRQAVVTHGHPLSQVCCALYAVWARRMLAGDAPDFAWELAEGVVDRAVQGAGQLHQAAYARLKGEYERPLGGSGYVVDSLNAARVLLAEESSYEDVVQRAIGLGNDTDTTACIAGGVAGIRWGVEGIPERWRSALRGEAVSAPLLRALKRRVDGEAGPGVQLR